MYLRFIDVLALDLQGNKSKGENIMTIDKDKLLDVMRDNIKEKEKYIDDLLTENVQLKKENKKLREVIEIERKNTKN